MPRIRGPVYGSMPVKGKSVPPHAYLWCSRVKESTILGDKMFTGLNCAIEVPKTAKCTRMGKPTNCVQTASIYTNVRGTYWRHKGRKM
jgi:hypothetical protein